MLNLEKLHLHLKIDRPQGFIDGNDLKKNIINQMPKLNQFTFNIRLFNRSPNQTNLPSNEYMQHTFKDFTTNKIFSSIDYFEESNYSHCHIFTYPYKVNYYDDITNNFSNGLFYGVHKVSLFDERPFEYDFFFRIAQSFPFMRELTVKNKKAQENKLYKTLNNNNQDLTIIKYPHLIELDLIAAHDDYVELFLLNIKSNFSQNVSLSANYESLKRVTHNFERHATRINCSQIKLALYGCDFQLSKHVKDYFLDVDID